MAANSIDHFVWTIYLVTCGPTSKCYVGVTRMTLKERWQSHLLDAKKRRYKSVFHSAIRLYGAECFSVEPMYFSANRADAMDAERRFIASFNSKIPNGYNMADGGYGGATRIGMKHSPETRARISLAHTGRKKTTEHVERIAAKLRGRKLSEAHAAIVRVAGRKNKGRKRVRVGQMTFNF